MGIDELRIVGLKLKESGKLVSSLVPLDTLLKRSSSMSSSSAEEVSDRSSLAEGIENLLDTD